MSERLTTKWTETAEEAFGPSGAKGDRGEQFLCSVFESWGWDYTLHPTSFNHQVGGVDITFRKPSWANTYTADVKANIDTYGSFFVETDDSGWLFNPRKVSDRIWHVNPDTGWMAWYGREEMMNFIESVGKRNTGLLKITTKDNLNFITRKRYNIAIS
jgi:hypothetical protein